MAIINNNMKRSSLGQNGFTPPVDKQQAGFIPMMLFLLAVIAAAILLVYLRVIKAHK
jgi:hypothetical protein